MDHHIYRRDGSKYPSGKEGLISWAREFEEVDRRVNWTKLWWGGHVSTVWLGFDHNFCRQGPPLIFETMVFGWYGSDLSQVRYSTEGEALEGHAKMVKQWSNPAYLLGWITAAVIDMCSLWRRGL